VKLPEEVPALLSEEAARRSVMPDELAARVLAEHIPGHRHLGFVAIGESTSGRTAAEVEEISPKDSAADSAGRHQRPAGRRRSKRSSARSLP